MRHTPLSRYRSAERTEKPRSANLMSMCQNRNFQTKKPRFWHIWNILQPTPTTPSWLLPMPKATRCRSTNPPPARQPMSHFHRFSTSNSRSGTFETSRTPPKPCLIAAIFRLESRGNETFETLPTHVPSSHFLPKIRKMRHLNHCPCPRSPCPAVTPPYPHTLQPSRTSFSSTLCYNDSLCNQGG